MSYVLLLFVPLSLALRYFVHAPPMVKSAACWINGLGMG
jgi:hypothetical protein